MSDPRSQSPRFALQRKCSRCPSSSSRDQRGRSRSRVHRAWRGVAQTEVQFVVTGVCSPVASRFRTGLRCFVRHCLPLCGTNSARRALAVGVTPNRFVLSSWFVCYCSRSVGCAGRKGEARNPLNSRFISLCCGHLGAGLDCVSQHCPVFPFGMLHRPPPAKSLYSSAQSSSLRWCLGTPHLRIGFSVAGHRRRDGKDDDSTPTFVVRRNLCIVRGCCGSSRLPDSHSFAVDNLRRLPNRKLGCSPVTSDLWHGEISSGQVI